MRYLLYSDVHFSRTSSIIRTIGDTFSTRLENGIKSVSWAEKYAEENSVDEIICLGDFFQAPDLTSEELTALQQIKWANLPHTFLVGNHDASRKDLLFNSVNALRNLGFNIVEKVIVKSASEKCNLLLIPYLQDDTRKTIAEYKLDFKCENKCVVLSHNDVHCQYGPYKNESGFEIDDIENNCSLFLNGHIHNMYHFCKNGFNVGNLTGQNFNEDAFNYIHPIFILDVNGDEINLDVIENPFAFNFYQFQINSDKDFSIFDDLKDNAIVSIKCKEELIETVKLKIQSTPHIIQSRIICNKVLEGNNSEIKLETLNSVNHIDELEKFTINQLGDSKEVREELNKIRNN